MREYSCYKSVKTKPSVSCYLKKVMKCIVMLSQLYNLHGQCVNRVDYLINLVILYPHVSRTSASLTDQIMNLTYIGNEINVLLRSVAVKIPILALCTGRGARSTPTSVPGPSRWDGDEDPGKIHFIVPKFLEKNRMRSATQPYCNNGNNGWIRLCLTAHAIFSPKFWNDKTNFTRVFVTVSPRRPWDWGWVNSRRPGTSAYTSYFHCHWSQ